MKTMKRQARRGTLKVVKGTHTKPSLEKIILRSFGEVQYQKTKALLEEILSPECLIRLAQRKCQDSRETFFLVLIIANRSGDLKKRPGEKYGLLSWEFRGNIFRIPDLSDPDSPLIKNTLYKIRSQFTDCERKEVRKPVS